LDYKKYFNNNLINRVKKILTKKRSIPKVDVNSWLLWSRFAILNLFGLVGLLLMQVNGWIAKILDGDPSKITVIIFSLFVVGLVLTGIRISKLTRELNEVRSGRSKYLRQYWELFERRGQAVASQVTQIRLFSKILWIKRIASSLVALGLIGTVFGAISFLLGIDVAALGDVEKIGSAFAVVLKGMGIALYTTLVGAVLNLWLSFNFGIVENGTSDLIAALMDHDQE